MAQWVKYSPPKNEDLSSIPSIYVKLDALVRICNPTAPMARRELEKGVLSSMQASQPSECRFE